MQLIVPSQQILQALPVVVAILLALCLNGVWGQKGGAKGAMRGRGRGKSGRGGGGRAGGYNTGEVDTFDNFGGGYGGKGRPCVGLCYLRQNV